MSDEDLLSILEVIAERLDRIEKRAVPLNQLAPVMERLDRIEAEQLRLAAAIGTVAETALWTYKATGAQTGLPDEVIDAPVMEQAILRAPLAMPVRRDAMKDKAHLDAIIERGAAAIDAEIKALRQQMQGMALSERLRLTHRFQYLDQAMKRSFEQYRRQQERER